MQNFNVPITPSGVGFASSPIRWSYAQYGQFLNVFGIKNHINMIFNLKSAQDIDTKLKLLYQKRDEGLIDGDDISELEERLRTYSNLEIGDGSMKTISGIRESVKRRKGQKYVTYTHGRKVIHVARGSSKRESSSAQKRAAEHAREFAHTEEANKNRRKSIKAKSDDKLLDEG